MIDKVTRTISEGLKGQPLAFALVVINILFLLIAGFALREIGKGLERRDAIITNLIKSCVTHTREDEK